MKITHYSIFAPVSKRIAVLADFHSRNSRKQNSPAYLESIMLLLNNKSPDMIVCPGDIFNHTDEFDLEDCFNANGYRLLKEVRKIAPVYYSIGNHEHSLSQTNRHKLEDCGIVVLDDDWVKVDEICIGGLTTGYLLDREEYSTQPSPNTQFISEFAENPLYKILLCHHPEYWQKYICKKSGAGIDLTISGHAHGGQWGFFSRGVYAPGQGLFPKYVKGVHNDGTEYLAISRGMTNTVPVPRLFNPCEIVILQLGRQ